MASSVSGDKKVMDVSKPGKGKVSETSRPVVAPIVDEKSSDSSDDIKVETTLEPAPEAKAPSQARKVIQPISDDLTSDEVEVDVASHKTPGEETPPTESSAEDAAEESKVDSPVIESTGDPIKPGEIANNDETADEPKVSSQEKSAETTDTSDEKSAKASSETSQDEKPAAKPAEGDDAASVDALMANTKTRKELEKQAEEEAKKNAALQDIIDSKKYFVRTSHGHVVKSSSSATWIIVVLLLIVALLASAYLLADAGVVDSPVELPFDLIK